MIHNQSVKKESLNPDRAVVLNQLIDSLCAPYSTQFQKLSTLLDLASSVNIIREDKELSTLSVDDIVTKIESASTRDQIHSLVGQMLTNQSHDMYSIFKH